MTIDYMTVTIALAALVSPIVARRLWVMADLGVLWSKGWSEWIATLVRRYGPHGEV